MSLFIGGLAFPGAPLLVEAAKIGILLRSLVAALTGFAILRLASPHPQHDAVERDATSEIRADGDVRDTSEPRGAAPGRCAAGPHRTRSRSPPAPRCRAALRSPPRG